MGAERVGMLRWMPLTVAIAVVLTIVPSPTPASAAVSPDSFEACLLERANEARADAGRTPLQAAHDVVDPVREWSEWMSNNGMEHMPSSLRTDILPSGTTIWGENIAWHSNENLPDCDAIHQMWMNSTPHRANILSASFRFVAIGTHVDDSGWWATQLFFDADGYPATCEGRFCDDDGSVFESSIEKIAAAGITSGCNPPTNTRFCPDDLVTRGQMAAFLARALDLSSTNEIDFIDDDGSPFESAIEAIAGDGITLGCNPPSNTRFCPDQFVTRGQMAAFLARALDL